MFNYFLEALKKYAQFDGRARRSEYWYFTLVNTVIRMTLTYGGAAVADSTIFPVIMGLVYTLATLVPTLAVAVRRMHDVGKSGWYILIPFYNLYLACQDSQLGENGYGSNPKGIGNQETDNDLIQSIGQ